MKNITITILVLLLGIYKIGYETIGWLVVLSPVIVYYVYMILKFLIIINAANQIRRGK